MLDVVACVAAAAAALAAASLPPGRSPAATKPTSPKRASCKYTEKVGAVVNLVNLAKMVHFDKDQLY